MSERPSEYQVGRCKPPQHTRFRKGRSGNPKGRPKTSRKLTSLALQIMNEKVTVTENGRRRQITKLQAALKQLINKAASGDFRATREVLKMRADIASNEADTDEKIVVQIVRFGDTEPRADR
jgi:hypothetical protein